MSDHQRLSAILQDYESGRLDQAETRLATYSQAHPGDMQALHLAAMVAARRGDYRRALTRIRASLHGEGSDRTGTHEKLNVQGNILRALGMDVDAQTSFEAALAAQPGFRPARGNLAKLLLATSQPEEAARHLARLREHDATNMEAGRGEVEALIAANRIEDAERVLRTLRLSPEDTAALRAQIRFYQGRFEDTLGEAARAVESRKLGAGAFALALQTLKLTGGFDAAHGLVEDTLANHPARADLWAVALRSLHASGDTDAALQLYGRAPRDVDVMVARADIAVDQGHFADAQDLAMQALKLRQAHPPAMRALCLASLGLGADDPLMLDQAQNVADLGLRANPNDQFYWAVKITAGRAKGQDHNYYADPDRFIRTYDLDPPKGWDSMESFNADLAGELDALHGYTDAPLDQTLRAGTQTAPDLRFVRTPAVQAFFEAVEPAIAAYVAEMGRDKSHAFLRRNIGGHRVRSAWSVRLGGGGHHVSHIHPEGWISSAYYVRVPQTSGDEGHITFGQPPRPIAQSLELGYEHAVEPRPGRLVLFPSYLWHGTVPVRDGDAASRRLTLPIDILPAKPPVDMASPVVPSP